MGAGEDKFSADERRLAFCFYLKGWLDSQDRAIRAAHSTGIPYAISEPK